MATLYSNTNELMTASALYSLNLELFVATSSLQFVASRTAIYSLLQYPKTQFPDF